MKTVFLAILFLVQFRLYSQNRNSKDNFIVKIREEKGDLNKDGLADKVVVVMDTANPIVPLRLQIFFSQPGKTYKLITSSTRLMEAQYPTYKKGKHSDHQIPDFFVESGTLRVVSDIKNGNGQAEHTFRFQNGNFELIHVSRVAWDGKNITVETEFNLTTGARTEKTQLLGSDKASIKNRGRFLVRPLPIIQNFVLYEDKLY